ncbi:hypothetical protein AYI68_g6044 [Smittium mucronatum]|uniref:SANTA domain-containing protein n=1 Tax=Smittium mucronatum TaxID=133383 RepID=A0A1R0GSL9_9FUNG|nr:hypothetical protein AYI68_g6044 [Smittium mucronatum]
MENEKTIRARLDEAYKILSLPRSHKPSQSSILFKNPSLPDSTYSNQLEYEIHQNIPQKGILNHKTTMPPSLSTRPVIVKNIKNNLRVSSEGDSLLGKLSDLLKTPRSCRPLILHNNDSIPESRFDHQGSPNSIFNNKPIPYSPESKNDFFPEQEVSGFNAKKSLSNWKIIFKKPLQIADSDPRIVIQGDVVDENFDTLSFKTAFVEKRLISTFLQSISGSIYHLDGPMDVSFMLDKGHDPLFCEKFESGFPLDWKDLLKQELLRIKKRYSNSINITNAAPESEESPIVFYNARDVTSESEISLEVAYSNEDTMPENKNSHKTLFNSRFIQSTSCNNLQNFSHNSELSSSSNCLTPTLKFDDIALLDHLDQAPVEEQSIKFNHSSNISPTPIFKYNTHNTKNSSLNHQTIKRIIYPNSLSKNSPISTAASPSTNDSTPNSNSSNEILNIKSPLSVNNPVPSNNDPLPTLNVLIEKDSKIPDSASDKSSLNFVGNIKPSDEKNPKKINTLVKKINHAEPPLEAGSILSHQTPKKPDTVTRKKSTNSVQLRSSKRFKNLQKTSEIISKLDSNSAIPSTLPAQKTSTLRSNKQELLPSEESLKNKSNSRKNQSLSPSPSNVVSSKPVSRVTAVNTKSKAKEQKPETVRDSHDPETQKSPISFQKAKKAELQGKQIPKTLPTEQVTTPVSKRQVYGKKSKSSTKKSPVKDLMKLDAETPTKTNGPEQTVATRSGRQVKSPGNWWEGGSKNNQAKPQSIGPSIRYIWGQVGVIRKDDD